MSNLSTGKEKDIISDRELYSNISMKISVIIPSYNHSLYLRDCIDSVISQTYKNFELIIVDDYSSDSSWDIICEYKMKYPEIITIRHETNWGSGIVEDAVRNYATGELIALLNSDDVWEPNKLEKQMAVFDKHPEYGAVFTNAQAIDDEGNSYSDKNGFYYDLFKVENRSRYEWLNHFFYEGNCLCHPSILIKKAVYEEDGFFRKGLRQIPDFVKWIQVCKKHEIYVLPEALVKFRVHDNGKNASGLTRDKQIRSTVELFLMLDEYASITEKEEFLKIFPEADEYCCKTFVPGYAFGMICTQEKLQPYTRLYGMRLLYRALNNDEKRYILKDEYNFTQISFMDITGAQDIFGMIPEGYEQTRSLFLSYDAGRYSEQDSIHKQFLFAGSASYKEVFVFDVDKGRSPAGIRFDPSENVFVKSRIKSVKINGIEFEVEAQNSVGTENGWDIFVSQDPNYCVRECEYPLQSVLKEGTNRVEISGELEKFPESEISEIAMSGYYSMRDKIYDMQAQLKGSEERFKTTQVELTNEKSICRDYLHKLEKIESSRIYRIARRIKLIKT